MKYCNKQPDILFCLRLRVSIDPNHHFFFLTLVKIARIDHNDHYLKLVNIVRLKEKKNLFFVVTDLFFYSFLI